MQAVSRAEASVNVALRQIAQANDVPWAIAIGQRKSTRGVMWCSVR
jgi:hypothetical protein